MRKDEHRLKPVLRTAGRVFHKSVSRMPLIRRAYLRGLRLLKVFPDGEWKRALINSAGSVCWPQPELPAATVELCPDVRVRMIPHLHEFDAAAHVCRRLHYEPEVFHWLAGRHYDTAIDIGANVGVYSLFFSRLVGPDGRVFSFEPSREAYRRLLHNLSANRIRNVYPFQCAISSAGGFREFFEPEGHLTNGSLLSSFANRYSEKVCGSQTLVVNGEDLLGLAREGESLLLKIDVEGADAIVLRSLRNLIEKYRPDIVVEVLEDSVRDLNLLEFLGACGYSLFNLTPEGRRRYDRFVVTGFRDYCLVRDGLATTDGCGRSSGHAVPVM